MTPHSVVIDLATARHVRRQCPEEVTGDRDLSCDLVIRNIDPDPLPLFEGDLEDLVRRVAGAMMAWNGHATMSFGQLTTCLLGTVFDISQDPRMLSGTCVCRLDRALTSHFGDARLGRVALMTPQEILALEGVGTTAFDHVISELEGRPALSVPELITRRGKAGLRQDASMSEDLLAFAFGLPGHGMSGPPSPNAPLIQQEK